MAQWKETLEPYVKVQERVKTATLNPTAGEDLIIGVAFISDAGPSTPTLITSQSEFLSTYASKDLDQEYIESLDKLYNGEGGNDLASTMWSNAYRLAGSNSMLCVRASKGDNLYFSKPLTTDDTSNDTYILRDGELLKEVSKFAFSVDYIGDDVEADSWDLDGWIININGIGIFGNRVTDKGARYDYYCQNLADLVKQLNDTSKFFSPDYTFYDGNNNVMDIDMDNISSYGAYDIAKVEFNRVYLGQEIIDKENDETNTKVLSKIKLWDVEITYSENDLVTENVSVTQLKWSEPTITEEAPASGTGTLVTEDPTSEAPDPNTYHVDDVVYMEDSGTYTIWTVESESITTTKCYKSLVNDNINKDPKTETAYWTEEIIDDDHKKTFDEIRAATGKQIGEIFQISDEQASDNGDCYVVESVNTGMLYIYTIVANNIVDLNDNTYSGFTAASSYAINVYNSTSELRVRIRKFNHNASISKSLSNVEIAHLEENGPSPYTVLPGTVANLNPDKEVTQENDFYEVAVYDPSVNEVVSFFNIGKSIGRGDMEVSEINSLLSMIQLRLPDDMNDLGLDYFDIERIIGLDGYKWNISNTYHKNDVVWYDTFVYRASKDNPGPLAADAYNGTNTYNTGDIVMYDGKIWSAKQAVPEDTDQQVTAHWGDYWEEVENDWIKIDTPSQIYTDISIGEDDMSIITISDSDLKRALDLIVLDEVYTTEGLCDLGNTDASFQNYMANIAVNDNYFYPISTVYSTNYMVIGNSASKIVADSYKLYLSAPWDIDTGTLGWKFYAAPSVLYWETVARNRRNNNEFAPLFGQSNGTVQYQRPVTEFNKKTRQLLLSKKINTVMWDVSLQAWVMNDNYTKQIENTIMNDEGNSRLMIRISKAMPIILKQFLGKRISEKLCDSVKGVVDYFFKTNILRMNYNIDSYLITCNYDEALARQNKIRVKIEVRYQRALKYIEVFNEAIEVGMDFEG